MIMIKQIDQLKDLMIKVLRIPQVHLDHHNLLQNYFHNQESLKVK